MLEETSSPRGRRGFSYCHWQGIDPDKVMSANSFRFGVPITIRPARFVRNTYRNTHPADTRGGNRRAISRLLAGTPRSSGFTQRAARSNLFTTNRISNDPNLSYIPKYGRHWIERRARTRQSLCPLFEHAHERHVNQLFTDRRPLFCQSIRRLAPHNSPTSMFAAVRENTRTNDKLTTTELLVSGSIRRGFLMKEERRPPTRCGTALRAL